MTNFEPELQVMNRVENIIKRQLAELPPNTPDPSGCECGNSLNWHLAEELEGLAALRALLEKGDITLLIAKREQFDNPGYLVYVLNNLFKNTPKSLRGMSIAFALSRIETAYMATVPELLSFEPFEPEMPDDPANKMIH